MTLPAAMAANPMLTDAYDYPLPPERIAQRPLDERDASRLLDVGSSITDHRFADLASRLRAGDLLVANETRVRAARLRGTTDSGNAAEILVVGHDAGDYTCLVRPGRRLAAGTTVTIADDLLALIKGDSPVHPGARVVTLWGSDDVDAAIERYGSAPLPPYIHEELPDPKRYQTTFARGEPVSAAAPTAGLHFTDRVRHALEMDGVGWATLTLEVGIATFAPIRAPHIADHPMHEERFDLPGATAAAINRTRAQGGRIVAVGTTSMRVLESCVTDAGNVAARHGSTDLYITPGHRFRAVDGLLTNFHQPRSSLLVLVAAFLGFDRWRSAYDHALAGEYRFLSFGDCMLGWRKP